MGDPGPGPLGPSPLIRPCKYYDFTIFNIVFVKYIVTISTPPSNDNRLILVKPVADVINFPYLERVLASRERENE